MNEEIEIILVRYFSGEASEKELKALDIWLSESDENEKQFHQMSILYQYVGQKENTPAVDTESALGQFKKYMSGEQRAEGGRQNAESAGYYVSKIWRVAAAIAVLVIGAFTIFYSLPQRAIQLVALETPQTHTIFDHTEVTLFPGTTISYHKTSKKEVRLNGKATFKIDTETATGIVVKAGETYIKDIGTVFTVEALTPDISITVEVTEGEVWFYTEINDGVHLKAYESAMYDAQTKQFMMIE
jgi:ferric-dicitrate binding protein FerR (iron transport regulator)